MSGVGAKVAPPRFRRSHRMTNIAPLSALVGRVLIALFFILAGWAKLGDIPGNMAFTVSGGLPGWFVFPALALEIGGGLALLAGWQTRLAALGLAVSVAAGVLYHYLPAQGLEPSQAYVQILLFQKNLAIAGGLLVLAGLGAGAWSLDARQHRAIAAA
jgi:putative oxidoreductase